MNTHAAAGPHCPNCRWAHATSQPVAPTLLRVARYYYARRQPLHTQQRGDGTLQRDDSGIALVIGVVALCWFAGKALWRVLSTWFYLRRNGIALLEQRCDLCRRTWLERGDGQSS